MKFQSIVRVAPTREQATVPLLKPVIFRNHDNFIRSFRFQNHHYFVVNNSLQLSHVFFRLVTLQVFEIHITIQKIVFNTTKLLNRIVSISVGTYKVPIRVCRISENLFFLQSWKSLCVLFILAGDYELCKCGHQKLGNHWSWSRNPQNTTVVGKNTTYAHLCAENHNIVTLSKILIYLHFCPVCQ